MAAYRVCVADDCLEAAAVLVENLKVNDYDVFSVQTGTEALEACRAQRCDLILLDVNLPDMEGYEVCQQLKDDPATRDIMVVFITVKNSEADVQRGYDLGAVDYIAKPYNLPIVMLRIDAVMQSQQHPERQVADNMAPFDEAYTDQVTGLRNRRFLMERFQEEVDKAKRYKHPVSLVMLDVDEVLPVDDERGAAPLDDLLVEVAMAMRAHSRTYDILARFDGALFAAVLPHARLDDANTYAKKISAELDSITFSEPSFPTRTGLSISVVAGSNGHAYEAESLINEAMRGLLEAKSRPTHRMTSREYAGPAS